MKKPQISVRIQKEHRGRIRRTVARLTLNPVILHLSGDYVDWSGEDPSGKRLGPSEVLFLARQRFPDLPLSWAVEGYVALLAGGRISNLDLQEVKPFPEWPEELRRFFRLSPEEKIRVGERWKLEVRRLRRAQ